jgi:hypothetical protein
VKTEEFVSVYVKLDRIIALCEAPHWEASRKNKIASYAKEAIKVLNAAEKRVENPAPGYKGGCPECGN